MPITDYLQHKPECNVNQSISDELDDVRDLPANIRRRAVKEIREDALKCTCGLQEALKEFESRQWIPVTEQLPELGIIVNLVLTHSKKDVYAGFRVNGGWYCCQIGEQSKYFIPNGIKEAKITHWMPLHNPPQK